VEEAASSPKHTAASQNAHKSAFISVHGVLNFLLLDLLDQVQESLMSDGFGQVLVLVE